jgi:uncharacterized membrane protein
MEHVDPIVHGQHEHLRGAFGNDAFGRFAEKTARFFGTPQYIVRLSREIHARVTAA